MSINYFEGYFDELNKLLAEKKKLLKLKDRSYCPLCDCNINKEKTYNRLRELEELLEDLDIRARRYHVKINEEKYKKKQG